MIKPVSDGNEYNRGYQQGLDDFGITQLRSGIRSYSDQDFDADRAHDWARARKLGGVSDFACRRKSQRKYVGASRGVAIARYVKTLRKANSPSIARDLSLASSAGDRQSIPNGFHTTSL